MRDPQVDGTDGSVFLFVYYYHVHSSLHNAIPTNVLCTNIIIDILPFPTRLFSVVSEPTSLPQIDDQTWSYVYILYFKIHAIVRLSIMINFFTQNLVKSKV